MEQMSRTRETNRKMSIKLMRAPITENHYVSAVFTSWSFGGAPHSFHYKFTLFASCFSVLTKNARKLNESFQFFMIFKKIWHSILQTTLINLQLSVYAMNGDQFLGEAMVIGVNLLNKLAIYGHMKIKGVGKGWERKMFINNRIRLIWVWETFINQLNCIDRLND